MAWVDELAAPARPPRPPNGRVIHLQRGTFDPPARELLPGLERYARLAVGGEERLVGYVEASHGCVHRCRHCPVPAVYDGRIRVVQADDRPARHRAPGGHGRAPHHVRRPRLPQRLAPLAGDRARAARALPGADLRLHDKGRARARARRGVGRRWPPRAACSSSARWRASTTRSSPASTRATPPPRRCTPSTCCASTGSRPDPRSCPSRRGRPRVTCSRSSTSSPRTTWWPTSTRCSTRSGCSSPRARCCWSARTCASTSAPTKPSASATRGAQRTRQPTGCKAASAR